MTIFLIRTITRIGYFIASCIILVALAVSIASLINPVLNERLPELEKWVGGYLRVPIHIGQAKITWHYLEPNITFQQVDFLDPDTKQPKLRIRQVEVDLSLMRSLLSRQILPESFIVSGADITISRQSSGKLDIAGLMGVNMRDTLSGSSLRTGKVLAEILAQPRLGLKDIDIHYIEGNKKEKFVTLKSLVLENDDNDHTLKGTVVLNQFIPTKATIDFNWEGDVSDFDNLQKVKAHLFFYGEGISLPQWLSQLSWGGMQIKEGIISTKIWAEWQDNGWQKINSSFQAYELQLMSQAKKELQTIDRISGKLEWERGKDDVQIIKGNDIFIDFPNHLWPTTDFNLTLIPTADGALMLQQLQVDFLDVADVKNLLLASSLLTDNTRKIITQLNSQGSVEKLNVTWSGALTDIEKTSITAELNKISFDTWNAVPGVANLSGALNWDGQHGYFKLNSPQFSLQLKQIFANPIAMDQLTGVVDWQRNAKGVWQVSVTGVQAANEDIKALANMTLLLPANDSPVIDLAGNFTVSNAKNIEKYLPLQIFDHSLVTWLRSAFLSGQVSSGKALVQGRLKDFPFDEAPGTFLISGSVKGIDLHYADEWPLLKNINAELIFSKNSMAVDVDSAQVLNVPVKHAHAVIPVLGGGTGPTMLNVEGLVQADLAEGLDFIRNSPLQKTVGKDLTGLTLSGPMQLKLGLAVPLDDPDHTKVTGDTTLSAAILRAPHWNVVFDQIKGGFQFTEQGITANNLQGKLFGEDATLSLSTKSAVLHAAIVSKINVSTLQDLIHLPLSRVVHGSAAYQADLYLPHAQSAPGKVQINSNLKGISVNLPAPLNKKSNETKKLLLDVTMDGNELDQIKVNYAGLNVGLGYQISTQGSRSIIVNLNNADMVGQVTVPIDTLQQGIQGKFQHFYIASSNQNKIAIDPKTLPPLSLAVNDFRYGDMKLGSLALTTVPTQDGLTVKQFNLSSPYIRLTATGDWSGTEKNSKSHMTGNAVSSNVTELLNSWGFESTGLVAKQGNLKFNLNWAGAFFNPAVASMSGTLSLKIGEGRIIHLSDADNAKLGFGRMLNILSLQSIPRRLTLNFSDLFEKGYSFDYLRGDFSLQSGNAYTENMGLDGPVAKIEMFGRIGLGAKDLNVTLSVTPYVTSSLPVVATIASLGNPAVILASFMADKVIGRVVSKATTYTYNVTGSWNNPAWKQVDKNKR